jgi:DMSO reductase anchor subunit
MIYAQMRTVPRWHTWLTPALYLSISLAGGALMAGQVTLTILLLPIAALVQIGWWVRGDGALALSGTNLKTATGLGAIGTPRAFEPPHTGTNYLLREFVHVVGRRHAFKLRLIALTLGYALPVMFLGLPGVHITAALAVISHVAGIAASRWLFFAEAEHVVGLYYGKRQA